MFDPAKPGVYEAVYRGLVDRLAAAPIESNANATNFLDLECLAVLGSILASELEATLE